MDAQEEKKKNLLIELMASLSPGEAPVCCLALSPGPALLKAGMFQFGAQNQDLALLMLIDFVIYF